MGNAERAQSANGHQVAADQLRRCAWMTMRKGGWAKGRLWALGQRLASQHVSRFGDWQLFSSCLGVPNPESDGDCDPNEYP